MENKSLFISSCTRRDLARRRAGRFLVRAQPSAALLVIVAALATIVIVHAGV